MSNEVNLTKKQLLDVLDLWMKDEWNIKGGMARALVFKGKRKKADEIVSEVALRERAYQQIVALIGASEEVTEEWIEEKAIRLFNVAMKWFNNEKITSQQKIEIGQGFIHDLVEEIRGK